MGVLPGAALAAWAAGLAVAAFGGARAGPRAFRDGRPAQPAAVGLSLAVTDVPLLLLLAVTPGAGVGTLVGLALGLGAGRAALGASLLPGLFLGDQTTAHHRLGMRFGPGARRGGAAAFALLRGLQAAAVGALAAAAVAPALGIPPEAALVGLAAVAAVPVVASGVSGVLRADRVHGLILVGAAVAAGASLPGEVSWLPVTAAAAPSTPVALPAAFVGGAAWSAAAFATDPLYVQRLLGCGTVPAARRAMFVSWLGSLAGVVGIVPLAAAVGANARDGAGAAAGWLAVAAAAAAVSWLSASGAALGAAWVHDGRRESTRPRAAVVGALVALTLAGGWGLGVAPPVAAALATTGVVYGVSLGMAVLAALRLSDPMRGSPGSFVLEPVDAGLTALITIPAVIWMAATSSAPFAGLSWAWTVPLYAGFVAAVGLVVRNLRKAVRDPRI